MNKFSTSTNIIRDSERGINYIATPNSLRVINQIEVDYSRGIHSFNLIGSYGTGKSSFLWALEKSIKGEKDFFNSNFLRNKDVEVWKFVGKYGSFINVISDFLDLDSERTEDVLSELFSRFYKLKESGKGLVFIVDEFGKFLEFASKNNPERELYFIQEIAEFINDPHVDAILITAVHQNFDAYSYELNSAQRQEWTKVKGRFREITFNEPVEQLLYLAAETLDSRVKGDGYHESLVDLGLNLLQSSKVFNINPDYAKEISRKLDPLDIISANVLTLSLQKYGQNERSLFTFLETESKLHTLSENQFFHLGEVYDYLISNFYSFLNSRYNPDFAIWVSIKNALEAIELQWLENIEEGKAIVKAIGLLNLTANYGSKMDFAFLSNYASSFMGIEAPEEIIGKLENSKIIIYRGYNSRYSLFEGTDLDITEALTLAEDKVNEVIDVVGLLKKEYEFEPLLAKSYSYRNGTPRIFEFIISENPVEKIPEDDTDGFVNLIFNNSFSENDVIQISRNCEEAILFGFFKNYDSIKTQLFEIEKTRKVIEENLSDKVAVKELNNILDHQKRLLNHYVVNNLYNDSKQVSWIFKGRIYEVLNKRDFNKLLSTICIEIYFKTPRFKNELVNRHKISPTIHTAKRNYLKSLVNNWEFPDLGFDKDRFPPEKTIYLTLLKENGLEPYTENLEDRAQRLRDSSFAYLWETSVEFLNSSKKNKLPLSEFVDILSKRPYKLKQGLIDFWLGSFLFLKRDEFALFGESGYIPYITEDILELVIKYPRKYQIKAFDLEGVKMDLFNNYRVFLNQATTKAPSNETFIETIRPFLVFYRDLKPYAKETLRLSKSALAIRSAIANSKEPEKTFFEDFPTALGFSISNIQGSQDDFNSYIQKLQDAIREIRKSLDGLFERLEGFIQDEIIGEKVDFEVYKSLLEKRYKKINRHLCLPHQKTFLMRIDSPLEERNLWLSSISQALIGTPLESINDVEEVKLFKKFKEVILELDSLNRIASSGFDFQKEEAIEIEMSSFGNQKSKNLIRLPKSKIEDAGDILSNLEKSLSGDKRTDIYALAKLLNKLMNS
ncbi:hypothetical protein [Algoriphagus kandeliae]|nr:hypothetical protein [Algoriphagus kandeliae]